TNTTGRVRRHAERHGPRALEFESVWVEAQDDVTRRRVVAVHQRAREQLAQDPLLERGYLAAQHPVGDLIELPEDRDLFPDRSGQLAHRELVVVPVPAPTHRVLVLVLGGAHDSADTFP